MFIYFVTFSVLCSSPFPGNSQHLFSLLTATICLADIFMELLQPQLFPLCQLGATCELRAAFPLGHHFSVQSLRFCNSSQLSIIFNTQMTCIMTKPCHFTVYSFPIHEWVCKQSAHTSCWSASTTGPDHELLLSVSCFINSFLFYSSRDLSIYTLTFLKSLW